MVNEPLGPGEPPDDLHSRSNLTRLQLLYWVAQKLRPAAPFMNSAVAFTIAGPVEPQVLQRAFQALVAGSDALRTVIEEVDGAPRQRVLASLPYALECVDFRQSVDPQAACQTWLDQRCQTSLNLEACLFDSALARIAADQYVWYFNQHHIIADAASIFLLYQRLAELYGQLLQGPLSTTPSWPSFQRYAASERVYRDSPQHDKAAGYWREKLTPGPDPSRFYGQAPARKSTRVQRVSYDLGRQRSQKLRQAARQEGVFTITEDLSLHNLFAALFLAQLQRMSGNRRLGLVTPIHNRFSPVARETIGLLMELCPLQVEVSENDTFMSLIGKVRRETRETLAHYQYGSSIAPQQGVFDVMLSTSHAPDLHLNGAPVQTRRLHPGHGSESLVLHIDDLAATGNFVLHFDFHCDVFDQSQRQPTVQSFVGLLDSFLADSAQPLAPTFLPPAGREAKTQLPKPAAADRPQPRSILEFKLLRIWEELLDVDSIGVHDNFFDLGGNSWLAVRLFVQIEALTGQYLPLTTLLQAETVAKLARVLQQEMGSALWSTLLTIQPGGAKTPFFCVPGAGGNGLAIARIARHLGQDQPVHMFQIPLGGGDGPPVFTRIEEMAAHYVTALLAAHPQGPYLIGGYSAGAVVAFEAAQQLQRQGQKVALLAIIDAPAQNPAYRHLRHVTRGLGSLLRLAPDQELSSFIRLRDSIHGLNYLARSRDRWQRMRAGLLRWPPGRDNSGASYEIKKQSPGALVEVGDLAWQAEDRHMREFYAINDRAVKSYIPQPYPGRITLFRSSFGYQRIAMRSPALDLGWRRIAAGGVETYVVPGNHKQIVREPSVGILGQQLRACLARAQADIP